MLTKKQLKNWTDALRANPEQQITDGYLVNYEETGYCCLGKLCDTLGMKPSAVGKNKLFEGSLSCLPNSVAENSGLDILGAIGYGALANKPAIKDPYTGMTMTSLAAANDNGVPWSVIADYLDQYYPAIDG